MRNSKKLYLKEMVHDLPKKYLKLITRNILLHVSK